MGDAQVDAMTEPAFGSRALLDEIDLSQISQCTPSLEFVFHTLFSRHQPGDRSTICPERPSWTTTRRACRGSL
jgi:hypothetical protein